MPNPNQNRWLEFWNRLGMQGDAAAAYAALAAHYAEAHRAYHNLRHISDCLAELDSARRLARDPDAVEMAIWYHDVIYDPHAKDNEERSAAETLSVADGAGLPQPFADRVAALILATKHVSPPADADQALLVDIDLSILGQPAARFDEYETQIRREYAWVTSASFATGRSAVLRSFLERPGIYSNAYFREKYEAMARRNLVRSMAALQSSLEVDFRN